MIKLMTKVAIVLGGLLATGITLADGPAQQPRQHRHHSPRGHHSPRWHQPTQSSLAIIGDAPYGGGQMETFPALVSSINEAEIETIVHLGDIKTGSSACSNDYFAQVAALFTTFDGSLLYTPGDNEWTDCHRSAAGKYHPLERLSAVRDIFFAQPQLSLGGTARPVFSQAKVWAHSEFKENQIFVEANVVFATLHVVGSNNGEAEWFSDDMEDEFVDEPALRLAEVERRKAAALAWIDTAFDIARHRHSAGIVLMMQADMWDAWSQANGFPLDGFDEIVQKMAARSKHFKKPVLHLAGDSHNYLEDQPLAAGDALHGVDYEVPNFQRIIVQSGTSEWLRLEVDSRDREVFSWERVSVH